MPIFYLQMSSPGNLLPSAKVAGLQLREVDPPDGGINQRFYREVGGAWKWTDRAAWPLESWNEYLTRNPIVTAILDLEGEEIGYTEIMNLAGDIEIVNFGLLGPFIGRGLGGAALVEVVRFAWSLPQAHRVWLHTCENDHANALNNYQRRGFELYDREDM